MLEPVLAIAPDAFVAGSAVVRGPVRIGPGCVVDEGAIIVANGSPVEIGARVVVMPGAVVRSTGGSSRPPHPVIIGDDCLVGPLATLTGCRLGRAVYVATQVMVFHGARIGDGSRLGAGSVVHTGARLPARSRVGLRQFAIAREGDALVTGDLDTARELLAEADFFGTTFALAPEEQEDLVVLHCRTTRMVAREILEREDRAGL
jgi:carbonic anhydrase/acetyltransferase-like protein (isoleucine patch superfamily)